MVDLPWRDVEGRGPDADEPEAEDHAEAVAVCSCQDGTLSVYEMEVVIDRPSRSKFEGKKIAHEEITDVGYSGGIAIGYIQVVQRGVTPATGGIISSPVGENTLHFGRGARERARAARDAILERAGG